MPRTYFYVVPVAQGWALRGGAFAGRNLYETREEALREARRMAVGLFTVAQRPTGVRLQVGLDAWEDCELFGEM
ncbi:MAG: hypothetical protein ABWY09_04330 [Stenotrophomonas maltophilia]